MRAFCLFVFLLAGTAGAQVTRTAPRATSVTFTSGSASCPTLNPNLTPLSGSGPVGGRSSGVPGALHLVGCTGYRLTLCATNGTTIAATGTLAVYYWPDYLPSALTPVCWPRNTNLDETVPSTVATDCAGSTCQCVTFVDHLTSGLNGGWIYAAPRSVTSASGAATFTVLVEAACAY